MTIDQIIIINNETKECRTSTEFKGTNWDEGEEYIWEEGNRACDCNRSITWHSSIDPNWDGESDPCGDSKYSIKIIGEDGSILYED